jgi:hypothetical protein
LSSLFLSDTRHVLLCHSIYFPRFPRARVSMELMAELMADD